MLYHMFLQNNLVEDDIIHLCLYALNGIWRNSLMIIVKSCDAKI